MGKEVTWRLNPDLAVVEYETRVVFLDLRRLTEPPRILEDSAAAIWHSLNGRTTAQVIAEVARIFGVSEDGVVTDVTQFLEHLRALGVADAI